MDSEALKTIFLANSALVYPKDRFCPGSRPTVPLGIILLFIFSLYFCILPFMFHISFIFFYFSSVFVHIYPLFLFPIHDFGRWYPPFSEGWHFPLSSCLLLVSPFFPSLFIIYVWRQRRAVPVYLLYWIHAFLVQVSSISRLKFIHKKGKIGRV